MCYLLWIMLFVCFLATVPSFICLIYQCFFSIFPAYYRTVYLKPTTRQGLMSTLALSSGYLSVNLLV